ncbi:MAG: hypothetical protein ACYC9L_08825 [Sulfuricaulis sp.]
MENFTQQGIVDPFERNIVDLLGQGNLPQAEILLRISLEKDPTNAKILNFLGLIAGAINLPEFAIHYFSEAARFAPDWQIPRTNLEAFRKHVSEIKDRLKTNEGETNYASEKYLLIKAWGWGFWSDVSHILGQLLVAEITGRIPVVHWGSNSLFSDGTDVNAFGFYFEALSDASLSDLQKKDFDYWPAKWNHHNLTEDEINKWIGPSARLAGLYFLNRPERVLISDFHTPVKHLQPWIPPAHRLYGLSLDELYRYLVRQYLRPTREIVEKVESFHKQHLASADFIAVHARGSDKVIELKALGDVNTQYQAIIDRCLATYNCHRIFLMTDDSRLLDYFVKLYGNIIITTDCQRTSSVQGIHNQAVPDRRRLGTEVVVDAYIAAKAKAFVGNGASNPSQIVRYLKDWSEGDVYLIGPNMYHMFNTTLHRWQIDPSQMQSRR